MKILSLFLADSFNLDEVTKKLDVVGIFNVINSKKFPATHPKFIAILITESENEEDEKKHEFEIQIKKDGKKIVGTSDKTYAGKRHYYIGKFKNIFFKETGIYIIEGRVNEEKITTNLYVNLIKENNENKK